MRLLLDNGAPYRSVTLFTAAGHDALHVRDVALASADDAAVLEFAAKDNRVLLTLDADFHKLLALGHRSGPSVIRVRIEGLHTTPFTDAVLQVIHHFQQQLHAGAAITITPDNVRCRALPLS